jgi:hypothetical protein
MQLAPIGSHRCSVAATTPTDDAPTGGAVAFGGRCAAVDVVVLVALPDPELHPATTTATQSAPVTQRDLVDIVPPGDVSTGRTYQGFGRDGLYPEGTCAAVDPNVS